MAEGGAAAQPGAGVGATRLKLLRALGPGLVTGAADDDPSGIAAYTQAGAAFGYATAWTMLLAYPLMVAVQIISARIGRVTGAGIGSALRAHYPAWIAYCGIGLLLVANTINLGADIGAMAESIRVLLGGPLAIYVVAFGLACAGAEIVLTYERYVAVLKWLTLALFAYVATLFFVHIDFGALALGLFAPRVSLSKDYLTTVVAILGTTISPYLFFWQSSQEAEETKSVPRRRPLRGAPRQAADAYSRIQLDTIAGMGFSNLIALAIIATAAATLNATGQTSVQTASDAASALKPLAGPYAEALFALGIVAPGCSACRCWPARRPMRSARRCAGRPASPASRARPRRSTA